MRLTVRLALVVSLASFPAASIGAVQGPHLVGFTIDERPMPEVNGVTPPAGRVLQLYTWFPRRGFSDGAPMTFRDYLAEPSRGSERGSAAAVVAFSSRFTIAPADSGKVRDILRRPMSARYGAAPLEGRRPLVILQAGMNAPAYLYIHLAEHLANRGYVVVAIPSFAIAPDTLLPFDTRGIARQEWDLEAALQVAKGLAFVDSTQVAVGAWSVGGLASAIVAARHPEVRALLSLDSGLGYAYGQALYDAVAGRGSAPRTPFLHLDGSRPNGVEKTTWYADRITQAPVIAATLPGMAHHQFTSVIPGAILAAPLGDSIAQAVVASGTATMNRLSSWFLDRFVRGDSAGGSTCGSATALSTPRLGIRCR